MIRALCLVPIGVAVALPVLVLPSPGSGMIGALAGVLCGVGVLGGWRRLVLAGGALVLVHYALARTSPSSSTVSRVRRWPRPPCGGNAFTGSSFRRSAPWPRSR